MDTVDPGVNKDQLDREELKRKFKDLISGIKNELGDDFLKNIMDAFTQRKTQYYAFYAYILCIAVILLIVVFFGYKLYKSLMERERRKEEKKRQKQQKKKK